MSDQNPDSSDKVATISNDVEIIKKVWSNEVLFAKKISEALSNTKDVDKYFKKLISTLLKEDADTKKALFSIIGEHNKNKNDERNRWLWSWIGKACISIVSSFVGALISYVIMKLK